MSDSRRILFVADPDAGVHALGLVRQGGPVLAQLAPTADALRQTLMTPDAATAWDAVVYIPGGPVEEVEVAVFVPDGMPLFIVGDEVPLLLTETAAQPIPMDDLDDLLGRLPGAPEAPEPQAEAPHLGAVVGEAAPDAVAQGNGVGASDSAGLDDGVPRLARVSPAYAPLGDGAETLDTPSQAPETHHALDAAPAPPPSDLDAVADEPSAPGVDLSALADQLTIGLYRSTYEGEILYANPALAHLLGAPSVDALRTIDVRTDLGYPRDAFAAEIQATGSVRNLVVSWTRATGERVHTRENAQSILDDDGRVLYYEGTMEDVTAEVEAQRDERVLARQHRAIAAFTAAAAESSEPDALYRAAATALLDGTDADWACLIVRDGDQSERVATVGAPPPGLSAAIEASEVLSGRAIPPHALVVSDRGTVSALWPAEVGRVGVAPVHNRDTALGMLVWGKPGDDSISATDVRGAEALAWHLSGHLGRANALGDLRDTEASLAVIAERTPHVLYRLRYTPDGPVFDYLSPAVEALTGHTREALAETGGIDALIDHRDVLLGDGLASKPVPDADRYHAIYRMQTGHGPRWVENDARPWLDGAGSPVGLVGVLQDITERKEREDRLADAAQTALIRQRALVDLSHLRGRDAFGASAASIAAATLDADAVSFWSCAPGDACAPIYAPASSGSAPGFDGSLEAVIGHVAQHRALAIADSRTDSRVAAMGLGAFVQAYGIQALLVAPIRRDGRVAGVVVVHRHEPYDWNASEAEFAAAVADSVALALEREDRERAAAALATSQQRYQALAEMASDYAFAAVERNGRTASVQWATGACSRVTGYTLDELGTIDIIQSLIHPSSVEAMATLAVQWRTHGEARGEIQIVTEGGGTRWLDHHARLGPTLDDGSVVVYHSGQDVTPRKRDEAALVEARLAAEEGREAAERLNHLKNSFLANMSHEIRTPLTSILGFADLLSAEVPDDQRPFVAHIERNGRSLLATLNAVLDLSQLDSGEYAFTSAPTALAETVETAAAPYRKDAVGKGLRFDVEIAPDVAASIDPAALAQITGHLLSNAVKFTEAGGILVTVEGTTDQALIRISDTGVGISEAFLPDVFEAFRQEQNGHARSHEGSGLGLAVAHRLVSLLGGTIDVQSSQPGGTIVTVAFPRVAAPPSHRRPTAPERPAQPRLATFGDGLGSPADAVDVVSVEEAAASVDAAAPADTPPDDLLGAPFDFTFLSIPDADAVPSTSAFSEPSPPAPTDMFDFRFGRSAASDDSPSSEPTSPPASAPPSAPSAPAAPAPPPRAAAPARPEAPSAPAPPASADPSVEPVMIVRARSDAEASIPEATAGGPPEEAEIVSDPGDGRPTILVVEDNEDTRMLLERILRSVYDVTAVGDARSALLAMNQRRFSGLVLDINLGGKETGADVLRIARSLPDYDGVFAIALTAYALPGDRERLLESGFNEYISKPFTRSSLMETLADGIQV